MLKRSILNIEISEFYPKKTGFYRNTELVKRIDFGLPQHILSLHETHWTRASSASSSHSAPSCPAAWLHLGHSCAALELYIAHWNIMAFTKVCDEFGQKVRSWTAFKFSWVGAAFAYAVAYESEEKSEAPLANSEAYKNGEISREPFSPTLKLRIS